MPPTAGEAAVLRGRKVIAFPDSDGYRQWTEKLTAILAGNDIRSVTVARMTVPCCGGIQRAAEAAVSASGKQIPLHVAVISPDGAVTART